MACEEDYTMLGTPIVTCSASGVWKTDMQCLRTYTPLLRCVHNFKSDLINNMDHMRISGTEPSSVILSQTKWFKKL